jgi:hypothetical protein
MSSKQLFKVVFKTTFKTTFKAAFKTKPLKKNIINELPKSFINSFLPPNQRIKKITIEDPHFHIRRRYRERKVRYPLQP